MEESYYCNVEDRGPLGCAWGVGHKLMVYQTLVDKASPQSLEEESPRLLHNVTWGTSMFNDEIMRRLAASSYKIFVAVQQSEGVDKSEFIQFSLEYRAALKECSQEMYSCISSILETDKEKAAHLYSEYEALNACELVWHLTEIIFIQVSPPGQLVLDLVNCFHTQCRMAAITYQELLEQCALDRDTSDPAPSVESDERYWPTLIRLVLQGRTVDAARLLSVHSEAKGRVMTSMRDLLRTMPRYLNTASGTMTTGTSREFELRWQYWQTEVRSRLESRLFAAHPTLELVASILSGEESVWTEVEVQEACETWYFMLAARLLYMQPMARFSHLEEAARKTREIFRGERDEGGAQGVDNLIELIFELNVGLFVKEAGQRLNSWWLVAHLTDLLQHAEPSLFSLTGYQSRDIRSDHDAITPTYLREFFILDYSTSLAAHPALWQTALGYLNYCPTYGKGYQTMIVERVPLNTDRKVFKVLNWCESNGMQDEAGSVCRIVARRELNAGRLGPALSWAVRARDPLLVTQVTERTLTEYSRTGQFPNADILSCLGSTALLSQKMAFLVRYREFHVRYSQGEYATAASLLTGLLTSSMVPKKYWFPMLVDAIPLLQGDYLTSDQIYDLMHALQELLADCQLKVDLPTEELQLLQNLLAKGLAQAILKLGSVLPSDLQD